MKKAQKTSHKNIQSKLVKKTNVGDYLNLTNQEYLVRTLRLLGVSQEEFIKETKTSMNLQIFPKNVVNPTASKHFFFIMITCIKYLVTEQELSQIIIWYPPRNLNEQLEFKKIAFKILQNLQHQGKVPKNILITKGLLMGDTSSSTVIQFLRFLSELALRQLYIEKYSKRHSLIQISITNLSYNQSKINQNDINRFYVFPFVPTKAASQPPNINIENIYRIYQKHLQHYKNLIIHSKTAENQDIVLDPRQVIFKLLQQKQLTETLLKKVPQQILTQNRAFDRRRIIDKHNEIWSQLNSVQCHFTDSNEVPVIRVDGDIDKIMKKWEVGSNLAKLYEANNMKNDLIVIKKQAKEILEKFQNFKIKIVNKMKNF